MSPVAFCCCCCHPSSDTPFPSVLVNIVPCWVLPAPGPFLLTCLARPFLEWPAFCAPRTQAARQQESRGLQIGFGDTGIGEPGVVAKASPLPPLPLLPHACHLALTRLSSDLVRLQPCAPSPTQVVPTVPRTGGSLWKWPVDRRRRQLTDLPYLDIRRQMVPSTNPRAGSLFFWGCPDHVHDGPAGSGPPACFLLPTAFHGDILLPSPDAYPHPQVTRASSPPCLHFCPIGG